VVTNYTANALLSMGASPVMAHASNENEPSKLPSESDSLAAFIKNYGIYCHYVIYEKVASEYFLIG